MVQHEDPQLRQLMRLEWREIVENLGYDCTATEGTLAKLMNTHGWHSCVERRKEANEKDNENRRKDAALDEIKNGRWANLSWRKRVYSSDEWHFAFPTDLIKGHVFCKPDMKDEPFVLQEPQNSKAMKVARKVALTLKDTDLEVFTIDGPEKLRKRKDGTFFTKKVEANQSCVHAVAVISNDGWKSRLWWYDQPTNDNGKMSDAMYPKLYAKVFAEIRSTLR